MKTHSPQIVAMLALLIGISIARSGTVTVPNDLQLTEGNNTQDFPFTPRGGPTTRYQQVFSHTEFSSLSGPLFITAIALRPDVSSPAFSTAIGNIQINLSTTNRAPDELSTTFATNLGPNDAIVYSGPLTLSTGATGPVSGPKDFDITIKLATPFLYDPTAGNLLLDVRNFSESLPVLQLDATNHASDGVSRVYSVDNGVFGKTADRGDTSGLVVRFTFSSVTPVPNVTIERAVAISWPSEMSASYQMQFSNTLNPNTWQNLGNPVQGTGLQMTIYDTTENVAKRFYRVFQLQ